MTSDQIAQEIRDFVASFEVPFKETAIAINGYVVLDIHLVCDGRDIEMGYQCCMPPHHMGKCFSGNKGVYFIPNNR